ncbi:hypothetical protein AMAG_15785 [Allomyces macrogynus ATCC 38327]|uniref:Uncharacterized protein n=1 Tax=Allomyces macrogynus (strain ATCC 38327) TaxID=578462 RepID=A0A0L0T8H5_ALLM3|nr:hypothetical protein AMAG_15785 [Allomyces macrogynus ATCC 38327]|eukprot:KNE71113.1 hypothetical protein AMAG_15785 [Allomyces macrogynus ATCC 38327]
MASTSGTAAAAGPPPPFRVSVHLDHRAVCFAGETLSATVKIAHVAAAARAPPSTATLGNDDDVPADHDRHSTAATFVSGAAVPPAASVVHGRRESTASLASDAPSGAPRRPSDVASSILSFVTGFTSRRGSATALSRSTPNLSIAAPPDDTVHLLLGRVQVVGVFAVDSQYVQPTVFHGMRKATATAVAMPYAGNEYPLFISAHSLLFVDLRLRPGDARAFTFRTLLPLSLPPTHRGKLFRVTYRLVIHIQPRHHAPILLHAPFRVFSALEDDGQSPVHDLLNPIVHARDTADVIDLQAVVKEPVRGVPHSKSHDEIVDFLKTLDEACDNEDEGVGSPSVPGTRRASGASAGTGTRTPPSPATPPRGGGGRVGSKVIYGQWVCKIQAFLLQAPSVVFDISRNDTRVAKLKLRRTAHRLGDVIPGIVDFRDADAATHQVSIFLESYEDVASSLSVRPAAQTHALTTRVLSRVHEAVQNLAVWPFELVVPESATPTFATSGIALHHHLRVELHTRRYRDRSLFALAHGTARSAALVAQPEVEVDVFSCTLPVRILAAPHPMYRDLVEVAPAPEVVGDALASPLSPLAR